MRKIFADSVYWIALINPADQWFENSQIVSATLAETQIITTSEVLTETLNYYAEGGEYKREAVTTLIRSILLNTDIEIIASSQDSFLDGLTFYEVRRDKGYSLTDCISMNVMRERQIFEILTHDHHFTQKGFQILL